MSETEPKADDGDETPLEIAVPSDPLAGHPATAYFWGHVAGSGDVSDSGIEVVTNDEESAQVLAAVAGGDLEHETTTRDYAHDASITRTEDEYTLSIGVDDESDDSGLLGRSGALGLPVDGRGNYRFGAFSSHDRELLRGLLEGCGTVCFKSSSGTVGISFVHDDAELLELAQDLIDESPVDAPYDDLSETSSGGYWFGVDDGAAPDFGTWLYEDCEATGLFAPSRRRKLERSLEQATAYDE
ncbi:cobalamin biosynthesis protein [Haloterrigena sp. SYSU A558-1]|uniref:Cobalamin biosynthesis protein n=1 Tax=Haloterrigena gelatinilytica TaxID=2741724 RepID=A0A8J8GL47_9EURY|nr:cobalamin biosynthesis protein [Haloterrigena gelatinilytica]NUB91233.1 cobalamin biosynthesis protein [Haloterrigena gelatinilytica]NUC73061.1 cobalamin biosynthesis protein [Haloterrigena gelatinilytica]